MSTPREISLLHAEAMEHAGTAERHRQNNEEEKTLDHFRLAFELEKKAAYAIDDLTDTNVEPSRTILFRSAASLALECEEYSQCKTLIELGLRRNSSKLLERELEQLSILVCAKEISNEFVELGRQKPRGFNVLLSFVPSTDPTTIDRVSIIELKAAVMICEVLSPSKNIREKSGVFFDEWIESNMSRYAMQAADLRGWSRAIPQQYSLKVIVFSTSTIDRCQRQLTQRASKKLRRGRPLSRHHFRQLCQMYVSIDLVSKMRASQQDHLRTTENAANLAREILARILLLKDAVRTRNRSTVTLKHRISLAAAAIAPLLFLATLRAVMPVFNYVFQAESQVEAQLQVSQTKGIVPFQIVADASETKFTNSDARNFTWYLNDQLLRFKGPTIEVLISKPGQNSIDVVASNGEQASKKSVIVVGLAEENIVRASFTIGVKDVGDKDGILAFSIRPQGIETKSWTYGMNERWESNSTQTFVESNLSIPFDNSPMVVVAQLVPRPPKTNVNAELDFEINFFTDRGRVITYKDRHQFRSSNGLAHELKRIR